jgi:hypothetical protein
MLYYIKKHPEKLYVSDDKMILPARTGAAGIPLVREYIPWLFLKVCCYVTALLSSRCKRMAAILMIRKVMLNTRWTLHGIWPRIPPQEHG